MKNKKQFAVFIVMLLYGIPMSFGRNEEVINMQHIGHQNDHSEYYPPADLPEVYFDSDNLEIIIVADGYADYYDVNIISQSTQLAVISTQVDGYGDAIDVSSLPDGYYTITITSEFNNQYEGTFQIE